MTKNVHTEHCCFKHGCKYGDGKYCPVENGSQKQSYPCETCEWVESEAPVLTLREKYSRLYEAAREMQYKITFRNRGGKHYATISAAGKNYHEHFLPLKQKYAPRIAHITSAGSGTMTLRLNGDDKEN